MLLPNQFKKIIKLCKNEVNYFQGVNFLDIYILTCISNFNHKLYTILFVSMH